MEKKDMNILNAMVTFFGRLKVHERKWLLERLTADHEKLKEVSHGATEKREISFKQLKGVFQRCRRCLKCLSCPKAECPIWKRLPTKGTK